MNLSFGNMTLKLNIFDMCKQPYDEDSEDENIELIEPIMDEYIQGSLSDPMEICTINSLESSTQLNSDTPNDFSLDSAQVLEDDEDNQNFEELGMLKEEKHEEAPNLELKPLPGELTNAFLGVEQTYAVESSSSLTSDQKGKIPPDQNHQGMEETLGKLHNHFPSLP